MSGEEDLSLRECMLFLGIPESKNCTTQSWLYELGLAGWISYTKHQKSRTERKTLLAPLNKVIRAYFLADRRRKTCPTFYALRGVAFLFFLCSLYLFQISLPVSTEIFGECPRKTKPIQTKAFFWLVITRLEFQPSVTQKQVTGILN